MAPLTWQVPYSTSGSQVTSLLSLTSKFCSASLGFLAQFLWTWHRAQIINIASFLTKEHVGGLRWEGMVESKAMSQMASVWETSRRQWWEGIEGRLEGVWTDGLCSRLLAQLQRHTGQMWEKTMSVWKYSSISIFISISVSVWVCTQYVLYTPNMWNQTSPFRMALFKITIIVVLVLSLPMGILFFF